MSASPERKNMSALTILQPKYIYYNIYDYE